MLTLTCKSPVGFDNLDQLYCSGPLGIPNSEWGFADRVYRYVTTQIWGHPLKAVYALGLAV